MFDKDAFLGSTTTEAGSTEYVPTPDHEWNARIKKLDYREPKGSKVLDIYWAISGDQLGPDGQTLEATTGMKEVQVRQSCFLDITSNGALDMGKGKNVSLNKLREALGQNVAGQPWSPRMLDGQVARISTSSRQDGDKTYTDVKSVAKL